MQREPKTRRPLITTAILITILLLLFFSPYLIWLASPKSDVVTAVYTKTVPDTSMRQHAALMWFLKHRKVPTTEGLQFDYFRDYYGYVPQRGQDLPYIRELRELPEHTDLFYLTDAYGVYKEESQRTQGTSNVIYGGVSQEDFTIMREFLNRDRPTTLIAEYNTFGTPTHPYVQSQLYQMFRARWTGWTGQYLPDLSAGMGVHPSITAGYEEANNKPWDFTGEGFLFTSERQEIIVLESGKDIGSFGCQFTYTEEGTRLLSIEGSFFYNQIFDIIDPLSDAEILAEYQLDLTSSGEAKLAEYGIQPSFPAVISSLTAFHRTYYFAGNYADLPYIPKFHFLAGLPVLMERSSPNTLEGENSFYWNVYLTLMESIYREAQDRKEQIVPHRQAAVADIDGTAMVSRTHGRMLQIYDGSQWKDLFIHGVNMGIALPGKWFTDFPEDLSVYFRWLSKMGEMGVNTVRIYTLLDPEFYKAFDLYNRLNPDRPLWLMQEIWPEEEPPGDDYLREEYRLEFQQEIRYLIDAVHGNVSIPEREGRAFGEYRYDISPYIIGYLVGRELEPHEVETTDTLRQGFSFSGEYLSSSPEATPTEAWLAESADYTLSYEEQTYGWQHPVAIVNWPTLDALEHQSERDEWGVKSREFNDYITVDINNIKTGPKMKAGLFGAYHIYPNYPDFMNNEPSYDEYYDDQGRFRYGGYLREFMDIHQKYPAVIAEFGLATGTGNAHYSPDGYHHGSMSEQQQGEGIIRMYETMEREGYAGGVIFEWMDEWAKKTWTTEPYMIPYDRQILWHNTIDPEQNYGILAVEAVKPLQADVKAYGEGIIRSVELRHDVSYLHIDIHLHEPIDLSDANLLIGLDTYDRERGELSYHPDLPYKAPSGMEFLIAIEHEQEAQLLAVPPYNSSAYRFSSYRGLQDSGEFEQIVKLINRRRALPDGTPIPERYEQSSRMRRGDLEDSTNLWDISGSSISMRIPWGRINVADPSSAQVLDDDRLFYSDPLRDTLNTSISEGIIVSMILFQENTGKLLGRSKDQLLLEWKHWDYPVFQERLKESYYILQEYFTRYPETME